MTIAEHVITFTSFLLGLSIAKTVTDQVRALKKDGETIRSLHFWFVLLFIGIHIQYWAGAARELAPLTKIPIFGLVLNFSVAVMFLAIAENLFPEKDEWPGNLQGYYWEICPSLYKLLPIFIILGGMLDYTSDYEFVGPYAIWIRLLGITTTVFLLWFRDPSNDKHKWVHIVGLTILTALLFGFTFLYSSYITLGV